MAIASAAKLSVTVNLIRSISLFSFELFLNFMILVLFARINSLFLFFV